MLDSIRPTRRLRPLRCVIYGDHGVGKSTFAAKSPAPVFIRTEDGLANIDTRAFPLATEYRVVLDQVDALRGDHDFRSLVIDSIDHLEPLIHQHVCWEAGEADIAGTQKGSRFGFNKGYEKAAQEWRTFLADLDRLSEKMNVILIAHAKVEKLDLPESEPYDRWCMKIHKTAASVVYEWADIVAHAEIQTYVQGSASGRNKARGGDRVLRVHPCPARQAKTRYTIPDELPLAWGALASAIKDSMEEKA